MLLPYKYVDHNIAQLQLWLDFLFEEVWCNAHKEYSFELFNDFPEFKQIILEEEIKENPAVRGNDYITGPIRSIFDEFEKLNSGQRQLLKRWYKRSNNVEKVCNNDKLFNPISIDALKFYSPKLAEKLYSFYIDLYEHALDLVVIKNKNGNLESHYKAFVKENSNGICHFCGLSNFRSYEMPGHEPYDHYLPKEKYPLYSVNFRNLVPTCSDCNSIHKLRNIPIIRTKAKKRKTKGAFKVKRRAFYPYSLENSDINLKIKVDIKKYNFYEHEHIQIQINSKKNREKVDTWKSLYNIEKRYKDELTNYNAGKYWLVELLEEMPPEKREAELKDLPEKLINSKFRGKNFLKIPFLLACKDSGIL